jgi:aerobic C4-dicarboxylate transport protein
VRNIPGSNLSSNFNFISRCFIVTTNLLTANPTAAPADSSATTKSKQPFYRTLWVQVLVAMALAVVLGYVDPSRGIAMKPLGDAFIRAISMIITLVIFCTVVTGIAGMENLKKVGRVGGLALIYFEIVSTIALLIGLAIGNVVKPGASFHADPATLDARAVVDYAGQAKTQNVTDFLMHIIPTTVVDAFAKGDILEVVFVALLFGFALSAVGPRAKPVIDVIDSLTSVVFGITRILMFFAPIGAFGAMAFTVGKFGLASLGPLAKLIGTFWITSILFVVLVLGAVAALAGFSILRFLIYIKEEILLVLAVSSSEVAIPSLMAKLEKLGCSKSMVGLIVPTGFTFNTDGTSLYMTMAALFVAQATNTHLTLTQQLTILAVAVLTSKGASGVQGASFIALVATLSVIPAIPVAGMALILGIDRFLSMFRGVVNMIGNGVATLVLARWEGELTKDVLQRNLGTL